jgi:hypothetical protein
MERIDRQPRFIKKAISAASDGGQEHPRDAQVGDSESHWLSHAMAMWIQQDEVLAHADLESRRGDAGPR